MTLPPNERVNLDVSARRLWVRAMALAAVAYVVIGIAIFITFTFFAHW